MNKCKICGQEIEDDIECIVDHLKTHDIDITVGENADLDSTAVWLKNFVVEWNSDSIGRCKMKDGFAVGDIVRSRINTSYDGTYIVVQVNKTTLWVKCNEPNAQKIYKNNPHYIFELI